MNEPTAAAGNLSPLFAGTARVGSSTDGPDETPTNNDIISGNGQQRQRDIDLDRHPPARTREREGGINHRPPLVARARQKNKISYKIATK